MLTSKYDMTVDSIELLKRTNRNKFEEFMLNGIFSAINNKVTRSGQIIELVLLDGNTTGRNHEYLWLVYRQDLINGEATGQKMKKLKRTEQGFPQSKIFSELLTGTSETKIQNKRNYSWTKHTK